MCAMNGAPNEFEKPGVPGEGPQSALEHMIIEAYLAGQNVTLEDLKNLPPEEAQRLMKEASSYASMKLAEVEFKAKFRRDIHYE